jgi:hypothetical protein
MANAMEILGDKEIIRDALDGNLVKHYEGDNHYDWYIKKYINNACKEVWKYEDKYNEKYAEYSLQWQKWISKGMQKNRPQPTIDYWWMGQSQHLIELKVNHYRQKFWYWEKLKR